MRVRCCSTIISVADVIIRGLIMYLTLDQSRFLGLKSLKTTSNLCCFTCALPQLFSLLPCLVSQRYDYFHCIIIEKLSRLVSLKGCVPALLELGFRFNIHLESFSIQQVSNAPLKLKINHGFLPSTSTFILKCFTKKNKVLMMIS